MKSVFKMFGLTALVAAIFFSMTACDNGGPDDGIPPVMRTVTFNANGGMVEGSPTKAVQVEVGKTVNMPADPVYSSKIFWGWFGNKEAPYGNKFNPATPIEWDTLLFARWGDTAPPQQFDVTFNANGGTYIDGGTTQVIQVYKDETVYPPNPTRNDGYMVSGWYSNADGTGTAFDKDTAITADLTLYAQWKKPEQMPDKDRWSIWRDSSSSATLTNPSIDNDGLCTLTIGGTPEKQGQDNTWRAWTISAEYFYTGVAGKTYLYKFEAWTGSGTRDLHAQYYEDNNEAVYLGDTIPITTTRTTYTVLGQALPKGGLLKIQFQCADQLGTVNLKMIGITEYTTGKLTITNFSGILAQNNYIDGYINIFGSDTHRLYAGVSPTQVTQIKGDTITMNVYDRTEDEDGTVISSSPYIGNTIVEAYVIWINHMYPNRMDGYINKVPIPFTNGNASIDFKNQMQKVDDGGGEEGGYGEGSDGGSSKPPASPDYPSVGSSGEGK